MKKGKFSQPRVPKPADVEKAPERKPLLKKDPEETMVIPQIPDLDTYTTPMDLNIPAPSDEDAHSQAEYAQEPEPEIERDYEEEPEIQIDSDFEEEPEIQFESDSEDEPEEENGEEYPEEPASFLSALSSKNRKIILVSLCSVALALLIGIIFCVWYFLGGGPDDNLILNNVTVAGINIGGMTKEEAAAAIRRATGNTYTQQDMVIQLPDETLTLSPGDTGAQLDVDAVVDAAYSYGRTGNRKEREAAVAQSQTGNHIIALLPYLNLNTDYIMGELEDYADTFDSTYTPSSYKLEGEMPALDSENFDPDAACQTLILNPGSPGKNLDVEALYNQILDAYSFNEFLIDATGIAPETEPEALDLDAIYMEYYVAPIDAAMDMQTFEVTAETYGYGFDLDRAKELLAEAEYGSSIGIPMEYIEPEYLGEEMEGLLFRDVLGSFESKHNSTANRTNNMQIACESIDGLILMPGDVFDYNETVGERTAENGFKLAPAYNGGKTVMEYGGGICQVSSTIYSAALLADLEIVSRTNHSFIVTYVPYGMDATVSWGGPEFRFSNNTEYPIRINAEATDSYVKIEILGTDTKDYYVEIESVVLGSDTPEEIIEYYPASNPNGYKDGEVIQTAYTGYWVRTFKCKYDKETGELISREEEEYSVYKKRDKIIARPEPEVTEPTEDPTEAPTTPPTEAPTTPPATEPPATQPPATEPPATEPPATEPPATEPPATEPPATEPPATEPPATEPPATEPPATQPPATEPPAGESSGTE